MIGADAMKVTVDQARRNFRPGLLTDITDKEVIDHGEESTGRYFIQFAVNLTDAEATAVERRLMFASDVEQALHERAQAAVDDLLGYEETATPTPAQTVAVVKLLCKVVRALIRLQLRRLDAVDDTPPVTATPTSPTPTLPPQAAKGR